MDEANVGIQITDPTKADNPLVYVNDGFERMTGYTREEAIGRNPRFLQGEDTDSEQVAQLRAAIDAEEPTSLELRNERRDGTAYWNRISITPVRDEDDVLQNYIGIQQDVTERKERERQFEARKDLLGEIYETTTDSELTFEEKLSELLEASRDYFDLPYGFLTRIETGEETPLNHGQGLGLWMVRMIVTGAGGDASVETTDDGTEVCLRVPASRTVGSELSVETPR
ncbi:hypothetical protein DJ82_07030 [Halorubrum sp. Ib24]|nr:hypothetical protein DJ82_07030 [Halorubrum sp. Ib24]OYR44180.1 hypothetical protein DJ75_10130 [Halorubrum sp. Eb13]